MTGASARMGYRGVWKMECYRMGRLIWTEEFPNIVTNEGLDHALDVLMGATSKDATWYIGLIRDDSWTAVAAGDTAAQINGSNGWQEADEYDEAVRQTCTFAAASSQSITNSASPAVFTMSDTETIKGCLLANTSTKQGTSGVLFSCAVFTAGDRDVVDNDVLNVTYTLTSADA